MRRGKAQEREVLPDPKFNSKIVAKFINMVTLQGKKSLAEKMIYGAFDIIKQQLNEPDILKVFNKAIDNARPRLEVKPRRVGGATYQVPIEVRQERGTSIALRWIRDFAKTKKGKPMPEKLADEIIAAYKGE
ncbi:MAG: 30S ribosomal protein S7, partial [Candidatus Omnitrophota bacterium]|nr:30S ribosomal protein S7 [Candidatus Omnitrophota bacterium]